VATQKRNRSHTTPKTRQRICELQDERGGKIRKQTYKTIQKATIIITLAIIIGLIIGEQTYYIKHPPNRTYKKLNLSSYEEKFDLYQKINTNKTPFTTEKEGIYLNITIEENNTLIEAKLINGNKIETRFIYDNKTNHK